LAATQNRPEAIGIGPAVVAAPDRGKPIPKKLAKK
jgi:hypothetical protein